MNKLAISPLALGALTGAATASPTALATYLLMDEDKRKKNLHKVIANALLAGSAGMIGGTIYGLSTVPAESAPKPEVPPKLGPAEIAKAKADRLDLFERVGIGTLGAGSYGAIRGMENKALASTTIAYSLFGALLGLISNKLNFPKAHSL